MRKFKETAKKIVVKYGATIATCAFAFVAISANTSCWMPFYEPKEPDGVEKFKKHSRKKYDDVDYKTISQGYPCDDMYTYHQ